MPALSFKKQFAGLVESGQKCQTIRACREDGHNPRPGQTLYLYVGQRTKGCRKLGEAKCVSVDPITIDETGIFYTGLRLRSDDEDAMARADGFLDFMDMRDWFLREYGLPFYGLLIKWTPATDHLTQVPS